MELPAVLARESAGTPECLGGPTAASPAAPWTGPSLCGWPSWRPQAPSRPRAAAPSSPCEAKRQAAGCTQTHGPTTPPRHQGRRGPGVCGSQWTAWGFAMAGNVLAKPVPLWPSDARSTLASGTAQHLEVPRAQVSSLPDRDPGSERTHTLSRAPRIVPTLRCCEK